ncbi:MAG: S8 family serine peptidase, partial [Bacteroidota bacterium]
MNPTQISQRDANRFLLEYDDTASQANIEADRQALIAEGATRVDSFICEAVKLELWLSSDPIELETKRLSAKNKASVDTTNYNYLFESREFQVNSYALGIQSNATVSMDKNGNFAMVWRDTEREHNYGRLYNSSGNPVTPEFQVGATDRNQYNSSIAMKADGSFIVVWYEINPAFSEGIASVLGRAFDAEGVPTSAPFEISVAAAAALPTGTAEEIEFKETVEIGTNPQIGVDNNGNYLVVWNAGFNIFAQKFDANNNLQGGLIQIGSDYENLCTPLAAVDMNDNGDFVATWVAYEGSDDPNDINILAQRYNSTGIAVGDSILVNSRAANTQSKPDVALANDGSFIITWESEDPQGIGFNYNIYARRFDSNGQALTSDFLVNTYTNDDQSSPSISLFEDGRYAIAWTSEGQDGYEEGIFAKLYDNNNNPIPTGITDNDSTNGVGNEFRMNNFVSPEQQNPQLTNDGSSILLSAWEDGGNETSNVEGETSLGIFGQRYELIGLGVNTIFYPIGTATPSKLLGDTILYPNIAYAPGSAKKAVKVATIDTGIDRFHPFLVNAIWENPELNDSDNCQTSDVYGYNFANESADITDTDGHGTGVNGIIARDFDSNVELELMNLKFHDANRGNVFDAVCSIYYAVDNGAEVLNLSWGFEAGELPNILYKALEYAQSHDLIIITSAGNTSKNNDNINKYPANFDFANMIVVTAYSISNNDGSIELSNYASYGATTVDIAAPGFYEIPLFGTNNKTLSAGTSLAAPLVARTAAIIRGKYPNLSASEIIDCILSSAQAVSSLSNKVSTGGILDHDLALACAKDKAGPEVAIRVFLQGPLSGMSMSNHLPPLSTFPMSEPYTALGNYGMLNNSNVTTKQEILTDKFIVDWVLVELRDNTTNVISRRAVLLNKDGYIIDPVTGECPFFPEAVF